MIKCLFLLLILSSCTRLPDLRPTPIIQSESLLQKGIKAYQQDNYTLAINLFSQAKRVYQSIDEQQGQTLATLNLIEAALAINQLSVAQQNLSQIHQHPKSKLLYARLLFAKKSYPQALQALPVFNNKTINQRLTQLKFVLFAQDKSSPTTLKNLREAIKKTPLDTAQQALFNRLLALKYLQDKHPKKALPLITSSLNYYKKQADRRAIATCLQEMAAIQIALGKLTSAKNTLNRALFIRQWLKDKIKTQELQKLINRLN